MVSKNNVTGGPRLLFLFLLAGPVIARAVLSAGVGADLRLREHLFATPSINYTVLAGGDGPSYELRNGLAIAFGLTLR